MYFEFPAFATLSQTAFSLPFWKSLFSLIRIVFIFLSFGLLIGIVYFSRQARRFRPPFVPFKKIAEIKNGPDTPVVVLLTEEWASLATKIGTARLEDFPLLIIEADKLTDEALKRLGYQGSTMLERLQSLARSRTLQSLDIFWRAHKVRNQIAHEHDFVLSRDEALKHLAAYRSFLHELKML